MNIQVEKEDIAEIGHTHYNENGNLAIMCSIETHGIELIFLILFICLVLWDSSDMK